MAYDLVNLTYRYPVNKQQSKKTNQNQNTKKLFRYGRKPIRRIFYDQQDSKIRLAFAV
jgi:hypothetical protein